MSRSRLTKVEKEKEEYYEDLNVPEMTMSEYSAASSKFFCYIFWTFFFLSILFFFSNNLPAIMRNTRNKRVNFLDNVPVPCFAPTFESILQLEFGDDQF